jgi:hypothetical protein
MINGPDDPACDIRNLQQPTQPWLADDSLLQPGRSLQMIPGSIDRGRAFQDRRQTLLDTLASPRRQGPASDFAVARAGRPPFIGANPQPARPLLQSRQVFIR